MILTNTLGVPWTKDTFKASWRKALAAPVPVQLIELLFEAGTCRERGFAKPPLERV
jgi:hypothetical protein